MQTCDHIVIEGNGRAYRSCRKRGTTEIDGFHFCRTHRTVYDNSRAAYGIRPPERCHVIGTFGVAGHYCPNDKFPGHKLCQRHLPPELGGPERVFRFIAGWMDNTIRIRLADPTIRVHRFEDWAGGIPPEHGGPVALLGAPVAPPPAIAAFAADPQNVHRKVVSVQTNKATEFLLKTPAAVNPWKEICANLLTAADNNMRRYINVLDDMQKWIQTRTCRAQNDDLYRKLLYSLVTYIKSSEHKDDLWKRLWEECVESVGMCCEGHISRLCNVLVGYVEGLDPPVSLGELTQQKMAAIAAQDIPEEDKKRMAKEFFDAHGVPEAERTAWLEAF